MKTQANPLAQGMIREGEIKLETLEFNTKFTYVAVALGCG